MDANGGVNGVNGTSMGRQWTPMDANGASMDVNAPMGRQWDVNGTPMDANGTPMGRQWTPKAERK